MSELRVEARLNKVDGEPSPWQLREEHEKTKDPARVLELLPDEGESASESLHVTQARHIARAIFDMWGVREGLSDTAELLMSEMLANAAEHKSGDGIERMTVAWHRSKEMGGIVLEVLRIEVMNRTSEGIVLNARPTLPDDDSESGRGLPLVEALAEDWGQEKFSTEGSKPVVVTHATLRDESMQEITDRVEVAA